MRLGDNRLIPVDVRLICCTNRDLGDMAREGTFRRDLLHRINTLSLYIPALEKRRQDIAVLARHFLSVFCTKYGKVLSDFSPAALDYLEHGRYEGNVRQLRGIVERTVIICDGPVVRLGDLTDGRNDTMASRSDDGTPVAQNDYPSLEQLELRYVQAVMDKTGGSTGEAAAILGISRSTLWRKLKEGGS
jgi:DNA-binding NtrC family response regulator